MLELKLEKTNHIQINEMITRFEDENQSYFRKVHRMIDLFEVIIKTHTTVILASCFELNYISDDMKSLLAWGLRTPSLGLWCLFSREAIVDLIIRKSLSNDEYEFAVKGLKQKGQISIIEKVYRKDGDLYILDYNEVSKIKECRKKLMGAYKKLDNFKMSPIIIDRNFYNYFLQWDSYIKSGSGYPKRDVISFRNSYAHGGTPSEEECLLDIEAYLPLLKRMLNERWLHTTQIEIGAESIGYFYRVYLITEDHKRLDLFPLLQYVDSKDELRTKGCYFLNDLKNFHEGKEEICLLNYPRAILLKEHRYQDAFLSVINIHEWKKYKPNDEFEQRINELAQSFKGRLIEKSTIHEFIDNNNEGFFMLMGNPGIGKSAIFAKIIGELKSETTSKTEDKHIIEYFIRKNTQGNLITKFLQYFHEKLDDIYDTKISYLEDLEKDKINLYEKLRLVSEYTTKKILIFIDGIDEGIAEDAENILNYLFTENFPGILVLYSSRWRMDTERFYLKLPIEYKSMLMLEGLKTEDIRGMLYEVTNKYELNKQSLYIEEVLERSEGNPLYVKLLCKDIEKGKRSVNRLDQLPENLKVFYDEIILRFAEEPLGHILLKSLYLFAVAEEYISPMFVEICLDLNTAKQHQTFMGLREVLIENPNHPGTYQIFHESLREYLIIAKREEINKAHYEMIKFCSKWRYNLEKNYLSKDIRNYAAKYYSRHLLAIRMDNEMEDLIFGKDHKAYLDYQIDISNQLNLSFRTYHDACELFNLVGRTEKIIQTAVKAYQLHDKKNLLFRDIFNWMDMGDLMSLEKASKRILLYLGQDKKNLYLLLLYYGFKSTNLTEEEKYEFINNKLDRSEDYLEITDSDIELPSFIVASIIEDCISYGLDFSKIIHVEYTYCKADCQQYGPFYEYVLDIFRYFIDKDNILACIKVINSIEDTAIASICGIELLNEIYEINNKWDQELLEVMLKLADKYDSTSIFPYPLEKVLNILLETGQEYRINELIKLYLDNGESSSHSNLYCLIKVTGQVIIALYKEEQKDLGDQILEEYFNLFLEYHSLNTCEYYYINNFIVELYKMNAFKDADYFFNLLGEEKDRKFIIRRCIRDFREEGKFDNIIRMADHFKDEKDIQSIIIEIIKERQIERNIPLLSLIQEDSILFKPFKSEIKDVLMGNIKENQNGGIKYHVDRIFDSIDENCVGELSIEAIIDKHIKKARLQVKALMAPRLFKGLIERGHIFQALKIYKDQWVNVSINIAIEHLAEYCKNPLSDEYDEVRKENLFEILHKEIEDNGKVEYYQVIIELLIGLYIHFGDLDLAINWYNKLGQDVWARTILNTSIDLYRANKKDLAEGLLEDLFKRNQDKLVLLSQNVEDYKFMFDQVKDINEEESYENEIKIIYNEKEIIKENNEKEKDYLVRLAINKYYINTKEEFLQWVSKIDNDYFKECILNNLASILLKNDEIQLLVELNNLLIDDRYNKMQSIAYLATEMVKLKDVNRIAKWMGIADAYIDTYYMKQEFYDWTIESIYTCKFEMEELMGVLFPYLFVHQELLGNAFLRYAAHLIVQDNELIKRDRIIGILKEIITLEDGLIEEEIEWTFENTEKWIHLIHDIDDQEEINILLRDYRTEKISEDRMKKKLNRIIREYKQT